VATAKITVTDLYLVLDAQKLLRKVADELGFSLRPTGEKRFTVLGPKGEELTREQKLTFEMKAKFMATFED